MAGKLTLALLVSMTFMLVLQEQRMVGAHGVDEKTIQCLENLKRKYRTDHFCGLSFRHRGYAKCLLCHQFRDFLEHLTCCLKQSHVQMTTTIEMTDATTMTDDDAL